VLLLSGRPAFLDPLSQAFSAAGLIVVFARDVHAAAAAFNAERVPAGVIIDLLTVDDDPAELCDRLRDTPAAASIPILFIGTGKEAVRSTTDALIAGGDAFFQLPIEAARITAKIAAYVGTPTPNLPQGLLVTIDEHDILERTPEPVRVVVPPAALPQDLLGDDDDELLSDDERVARGSDGDITGEGGPVPDGGDGGVSGDATPPSGTSRPSAELSDAFGAVPRDGSSDEGSAATGEFGSDFTDATSPMLRRPTAVTLATLEPKEVPFPAPEGPRPTGNTAPVGAFDDMDDGPTVQTAVGELRLQSAATVLRDDDRQASGANTADGLDDNDNDNDDDAAGDIDGREALAAAKATLKKALDDASAKRAQAEAAAQARRSAQQARLAEEEAAIEALRKELAAIEAETNDYARAADDDDRDVSSTLTALAEVKADAQRSLALKLDERRQQVLEEEARLDTLKQAHADTERALAAQQAEAQALIAAEEERLEAIAAARAEAEAAYGAARQRELTLQRETEAELLRLDAEREAAEAALSETERERQAELESAAERLASLMATKVSVEDTLKRLSLDHDARVAQEEARVEAILAEKAATERALVSLELEVAQRERDGDADLHALRAKRQQLESEAASLHAEVEARLKEQEAYLENLAERRAALEAELQDAEARRQRRLQEESAELEILAGRHAAALAEGDAAANARAQKQEEEEALLAALHERREAIARDVLEAEENAAALAALEEQRLTELAERRQAAAIALATAEAEHQAALDQENERLEALRHERETRERELERLAAEDGERRAHVQAELTSLSAERQRLEEALGALSEKTQHDEAQARIRIAELEAARQAAEDDVARLAAERATREAEARAAIDAIDADRKQALVAHEAQQAALRDAIAAEEARLGTLEAERAHREAEAAAAEHARNEALAAQEAHLQRLATTAAEQRARLAEVTAAAEAALAAQHGIAAERVAALEAEQRRLQAAAEEEAERLLRLRAEEEAARAAVLDARARARLSFISGRFDAVPDLDTVGGIDVGDARRAHGEGEGIPYGGPLRDVGVEDTEAPPPLPFVALEPPEGGFHDGELPALLLAIWSQRVTGAVEISVDDDRRRTVFFEAGEPVHMSSALPGDRPEEQLLKGGLITAMVHAELRVGELMSARRMGARLVDEGHLKLEELTPAVRGVLTEQLLRLVEWGSGRFRFVEERAHAVDRVRLEHHFDAVVAEGTRRKYDEVRLWAVLGGPSTLLGPGDTMRTLPPLSPEERVAISAFDGTRSLDDVVLGAGLHAHVVLRAAVLGVACGAVRVLARGLPRSSDDAIVRRETAIAIDRARIVDKLALARHGDYFSFLGVESTATPFEVHRSAQRLRDRFDPARYTDAVFADLRAALREIVDVASDAEAVLSDSALRDAYRANLRQHAPLASSPRPAQRTLQS